MATGKSRDQELYSGLIRLHILHHAAQRPVFGLWVIEELARHGYRLSAGTLYPILHSLEKRGYVRSSIEREGQRRRRLYIITSSGRKALTAAKNKVWELFRELFEEELRILCSSPGPSRHAPRGRNKNVREKSDAD